MDVSSNPLGGRGLPSSVKRVAASLTDLCVANCGIECLPSSLATCVHLHRLNIRANRLKVIGFG